MRWKGLKSQPVAQGRDCRPAAEDRPEHRRTARRTARQAEPRVEPQAELRAEPRVEPQAELRVEPQAELRVEPQAELRAESRSLEERVRLLYAQSGGPEQAAKKIEKLTQQHLLTGNDHGTPGQVETYQDVIEGIAGNDRSLAFLYNGLKQAQLQGNLLYRINDDRISSFIRSQEKRNVILERNLQELLELLKSRKA